MRLFALTFFVLVMGCGRHLTEVYRYNSGPRPTYVPDPTKQIERVEAADRERQTVQDGPTRPNGDQTGGVIYEGGGRIYFADGTSEWRQPLKFKYDGSAILIQ